MLARSRLNSIESNISEALINNQINHEDFITITNEERNRVVNNVVLLFKVQKNTESIDPKVSETSNGRKMILSKCAICGSKILKNKKQKDY